MAKETIVSVVSLSDMTPGLNKAWDKRNQIKDSQPLNFPAKTEFRLQVIKVKDGETERESFNKTHVIDRKKNEKDEVISTLEYDQYKFSVTDRSGKVTNKDLSFEFFLRYPLGYKKDVKGNLVLDSEGNAFTRYRMDDIKRFVAENCFYNDERVSSAEKFLEVLKRGVRVTYVFKPEGQRSDGNAIHVFELL